MAKPLDVDVRRITPSELVPWLEALSTAFLGRPDVARMAEVRGPSYDFDRTWGAFDGGVVGTLRSWPTELTVPGGALVPAAAVAAVTVLPTHRRRGLMRRMLAAEHDAARARGERIGLLYASEASIYGRFGYGVGVTGCDLTLDTSSTGFVEGAAAGGVSLVPVEAQTVELIADLFDRFRRSQAGQVRRRDYMLRTALGLLETGWSPPWKGWVAIHRDAAGAPDGYVQYSAELKWEHGQPRSIVSVQDLVALTDGAYDALWRYLANLDLVTTVKADRRSPFERLPWLLTNPRALQFEGIGDGLWVCLLDIAAALAARGYERSGDLVIEVVDADSGSGRSRVHLQAGPDGAACSTTSRAPDLTVSADALGAAYLGGTPLRLAVLPRGCDEHRAGALAEADALLRTLDPPRCQTFF
ncbi:MAG: GNAT family N-acetyltransferase [Chloroflexota bacterium]